MLHDQALNWFDTKADNLQRAGVRIRVFRALQSKAEEIHAAGDDRQKEIAQEAFIAAVIDESSGKPLD